MAEINFGNITCLIIDDDKFARTFVKNALFQIGIKSVKEAADTTEATEILQSFKFDLLLLDQHMPKQTGLEFVKELRAGKIAGIKNIPIVMITSDSSEETVTAAKALGVAGYLVKPISSLSLRKRIAFIFNPKIEKL